jgi:ribonuclease T2
MIPPYGLRSENRPLQNLDWLRRSTAVVCLLAAVGGCGNRRNFRGRETSGVFDFYVLALSWAPAFCAHETTKRTAGECSAARDTGFVVHGLWPERDSGRPLENCAPVQPVSQDIMQEVLPVMPDPGLIQHEWRIHGSCSGLTAEEYFAAVRQAASKFQVPAVYRSVHRTVATSPSEIERRFATVNHLRGASGIRVQCRAGEVREVRICLTKNLEPRACSWSMRDCRAGQVFMRAIK